MSSDAYSKSCLAFTLLEVLIAVIVLAVAVLAWMSTQQAAVLTRGQGRTMSIATELVQAKIEELSLRPAQVCPQGALECQGQEEQTIGGFNYVLEWNLTRMEVSDGSDVLDTRAFWEIFVRADWKYRGNKSFSAGRLVPERAS
ncbi:type IV pilus modification PilV family protein [Desulfonatronum lacustre]|uniref:type IV pilus modification PilV family protein n=1 Tax=Desulfonatronum lacustre TaxID=66849 RepID=UPI00048B4F65|nr:prepilin-type N-terminal cleavage/methylation domain-containing protein [Desulfonatronum lacustre]